MPSLPADDYYELLGVPSGADREELRKAWRQLALQWHPDRAGDAATATFQKLSAAYAVLSDPVARAAYDRRRRLADPAGARAARSAGAKRPEPPPERPPVPSIALSRLSGPLTSLIACGVARLEEPGFITLVFSEAEAAQGGIITISMQVDMWCPACAAQERSDGCSQCGGKRMVRELFSAWLSVPPGVMDGEVLVPSVELPEMVTPVRFRVQIYVRR
jgi:molecular chaperone DnaJ